MASKIERAAKRTDCHRPGAIVPGDYEYLLSFSAASDPAEQFNMRAAGEALRGATGKPFGGVGKCGVCGAHFAHGDVWLHVPSGDVIALGMDCAAKYTMLANRGEWDAHAEMVKRARKQRALTSVRDLQLEAYLAGQPELRAALEVEHDILADMRRKAREFGSLSDKQIAFAIKLAAEAYSPKAPKVEEVKVAAPTGRIVIRGTVVSRKFHDSEWGGGTKITVKVRFGEGIWLAWGSLPAGDDCEVGSVVEFKATLEAGREPHFAFFKRPAKAVRVDIAA